MDEQEDSMQGWAYQQELENQQWLKENNNNPFSQMGDREINSYDEIRGV